MAIIHYYYFPLPLFCLLPFPYNNGSKWSLQLWSNLSSCKESPEQNSEASTGFKPMASAILVWCSNNWAMKPCWKQVKSEFNLYQCYMKNVRWRAYDINHIYELQIYCRIEVKVILAVVMQLSGIPPQILKANCSLKTNFCCTYQWRAHDSGERKGGAALWTLAKLHEGGMKCRSVCCINNVEQTQYCDRDPHSWTINSSNQRLREVNEGTNKLPGDKEPYVHY